MKIYFYPHKYLRDRQLDTIKNWPKVEVDNLWMFNSRPGDTVLRKHATRGKINTGLKSIIPLINIKMRPKGIGSDQKVYTWGGIIHKGNFILDLDNPFALTGYNLRAFRIYGYVIKRFLSSKRCNEIRCISQACQNTLRMTLGEEIYKKSTLIYPYIERKVKNNLVRDNKMCRFLFIGTQFEIKGGNALLRAFKKVYEKNSNVHLDIITHLPEEFLSVASESPGVSVHEANYTREEISQLFMQSADVIVHPTYVDSFAMVVLEGLSHGLAVIGTDVYALPEMVEDGINGTLLKPPISIWDGYLPSWYYYRLPKIKQYIRQTDTTAFEHQLCSAMLHLAQDRDRLLHARQASLDLFDRRFARPHPSNG
jgi:glycosyltransferase involved in cell wall biosynthesis